MQAPPNPLALPVAVDTTGAKILEGSFSEHDSRDIYLPNHVDTVSHIAIDVGGSLAKVVYFTRVARPTFSSAISSPETQPSSSSSSAAAASGPSPIPAGLRGSRSPASSASSSRMHSRESSAIGATELNSNHDRSHAAAATPSPLQRSHSPSHINSHHPTPTIVAHAADGSAVVPAGTLTPSSLFSEHNKLSASAIHSQFMKRRSLPSQLPGGRLNFVKFETDDISSCVSFLVELISLSAKANNVTLEQMRKGVKLMATGGGAHLFSDMFERELGVEVRREDEMGCLITGLNFITMIPDETFYYSDELVDNLNATQPSAMTRRQDPSSSNSSSSSSLTSMGDAAAQPALPRPSPDPPLYSPVFDSNPLPKLPCLLVNIGSGVSIIKVDEDGKFERVSGTSLGGATLWGILSLVTDAESFDEMLEMASRGDNSSVDMLVSDVYGSSDALNNLGLKSNTIASSFGKVFRKDKGSGAGATDSRGEAREERRRKFRQEDICKSLLYAVSNNIGQIAYMNAEKFGLDRIYFGGCFIRGHQATIATLSYAIRFWSKGTKRAFFLRHEGYLGALGAWIRQFYDTNVAQASTQTTSSPSSNDITSSQAAAQHALNALVAGRSVGGENQSPQTPNGPTFDKQSDTDSANATPRPKLNPTTSQFQAATPALSRQPSQPAAAIAQQQTATQLNGINPILAEALGGMPLDPPAATARPAANGNTSETDLKGSPRRINGTSVNGTGQNGSNSELTDSLTHADREILGPLLDLRSDLQNLDINGAGEGTEEDDLASVSELLKKMDMVSGAADGLEGKLDNLLARLDDILQEAEGQTGTVMDEEAAAAT